MACRLHATSVRRRGFSRARPGAPAQDHSCDPDVRLQRARVLLLLRRGARDQAASRDIEAGAARRPAPPARDRRYSAVGASPAPAGAGGRRATADILEPDLDRPRIRHLRADRRRRQLQEPVRPLQWADAPQGARDLWQDVCCGFLARDSRTAVPVLPRPGEGLRRGYETHGCIADLRSQAGHASLHRRVAAQVELDRVLRRHRLDGARGRDRRAHRHREVHHQHHREFGHQECGRRPREAVR